ncbi:uncharacterized protein G2W53_030054 [Senna tora]|uniref:Uncharacterized protein n=1 Tax=Senna tora TaxID=362788 RepID=A0A834T612_9FABA|nr:uncharacterized protein G2W53_030054 [Senna tora]
MSGAINEMKEVVNEGVVHQKARFEVGENRPRSRILGMERFPRLAKSKRKKQT